MVCYIVIGGEPIGDHFRGDEAPLRAGENEVIAGAVESRDLRNTLGTIVNKG
jgi:hypothetical protein